MRVNFVYQDQPGTWAEHYARYLIPRFQADFEVHPIRLDRGEARRVTLLEAPAADVWMSWCLTEGFFELLSEAARGAPVVGHLHGGFENHTVEGMAIAGEDPCAEGTFRQGLDLIARGFVNSASHIDQLVRHWGEGVRDKLVLTGFPVDMPVIPAADHTTGIVVPGRVSADKQPILAAQILDPWRHETTFCFGDSRPEDQQTIRALEGWGYNVTQAQSGDYLHRLTTSAVAFTSSYMDTLNVSMVEAGQVGCRLVAPRTVVFPEYVRDDLLYKPFDIEDAQAKVELALKSPDHLSPQVEWYRPDRVYARMREAIEAL